MAAGTKRPPTISGGGGGTTIAWPTATYHQHTNNGTDPSFGTTTITGSATPHAKGSYTQLIASTAKDSIGFWLFFEGSSVAATSTAQLMDISVGAAASEVVLAPNIPTGWRASGTGGTWEYFPLFIAAGSRVAARLQGVIASDEVDVNIIFNQGDNGITPEFTGCDVYGADTATSLGTIHTPTNGSFSTAGNVGGVTSREYKAVQLEVGGGGVTNMSARVYFWECVVGGVTIGQWLSGTSAQETHWGPMPLEPVRKVIASGSQLTVRGKSNVNPGEAVDVQFRCYY